VRSTQGSILFNEHIVEDGPVVFAHACRVGAEGIVSKRVDGTYRSGPCRVWIKVCNPASIDRRRPPLSIAMVKVGASGGRPSERTGLELAWPYGACEAAKACLTIATCADFHRRSLRHAIASAA
jgi:hypothetical protein